MRRLVPLVAALAVAAPAAGQRPVEKVRERLNPHPTQVVHDATVVLDELARIPAKAIPAKLVADAHGVAVIPRVLKAGLVVAGSGGHGLVVARGKDGRWADPVFVSFGGGSVGFQAGVESTDVVLVFRDRRSLDALLDGKAGKKVTLGVDAAVAAGPVGRQAMAGTDFKLEAEVVSYSRSRGLFAGVALDGSVLVPDPGLNEKFRGDPRPEVARQVAGLWTALDALAAPTPPARPAAVPPPAGVLMPPVPAAPRP